MEQNNDRILFQEVITLPCSMESMAIFSERLPEKGKPVKIGGLGIAMVRKMVKKILYQYENGKNQLGLYFER